MAARARLVTAAPTEGTGKNRASPPSHHLSIQNRWRLDLPREVCRSSSRDSCSLRLRFALTRHKDGALAKQITLPELRSTSLEGGSFPLDAPPYDLPRGEVGRSLYLRRTSVRRACSACLAPYSHPGSGVVAPAPLQGSGFRV